ncbi:ParB/RepB/Spo0J family partition protein [Blautia obeum]|jgi:ParB family chromosome partitioning protein|uniref:ParB/RepB/Spo0J family partition protein n=1 Tax=Blautia obeum TaxID=40520 RepID=A0A3E5A4S8_9FIRM|nr:ParB/RepB/Spo0J family partition protein [Blautia obeum]RGN03714.1 ParB/RepB/Spo0J family partition protein [Blautia obeum]RHA49332.1 ParB/RepB/Spo0J family partition protein [Blautia obeum]RHE12458.1 ParB/RepB/Spo0J family partition protein [Blautia obeum]
MKNRSGEKIKMPTLDELMGISGEENANELEINRIHNFANHPFKVVDDEEMDELVESIEKNGILVPVLVRPDVNNSYEMIAGHRRMHAAIKIGLKTIPAIVRDLDDDEAIIVMVDSNIQRKKLLPSEKAFAYKMKLEAMKHRVGRKCKENVSQIGTHYRADSEMANELGESRNTIRRFIRLTELIPELLEYVDKKRLPFTSGVDISYLDKEIQKWLFEYIKENGPVKSVQVAALRRAIENGAIMTQEKMISILIENQPGGKPNREVTFSENKLRSYFPEKTSPVEIEEVILNLLEIWKRGEVTV